MLKVTLAKATLDFCPPDREYMGWSAKLPDTPNDPRWLLHMHPIILACRQEKCIAMQSCSIDTVVSLFSHVAELSAF